MGSARSKSDKWKPCSRCQRQETALCICCGYVCLDCLDAHLNDDDPDFCEMLRINPDLWVEWDADPPPLPCSRKEVNSMNDQWNPRHSG
jgi:hypothetical protein